MILAATKIGLKPTRDRIVAGRIGDRRHGRADTRSLLELDDHLLRDIGLTREQVSAAAHGMAPLPACDEASVPEDGPQASRRVFLAAVVGVSLLSAAMAASANPRNERLPTVADLPQGTIKLSRPIPGMGKHWARPKDLPLGPIYCVMDGKVICAEFMIRQEGFIKGKSFERLRLGMTGKLPPVNHVDMNFMPHGHEGFAVPHYDVHMYFVPPEARFPAQARQ